MINELEAQNMVVREQRIDKLKDSIEEFDLLIKQKNEILIVLQELIENKDTQGEHSLKQKLSDSIEELRAEVEIMQDEKESDERALESLI